MKKFESIGSIGSPTTSRISRMMPEDDLRTKKQLKAFSHFIYALFKSKDKDRNACCVLAFITRTLNQFRLYNYYDEFEVILKAGGIAQKKIKSGEKVGDIQLWFKGICLDVIRKLSKEERKILVFRKVKELSWKEIREILVTSGDEDNDKGLGR